ncbi:MAG: hypothetical protein ABI234_05070 [Ktedonobacteraceae bacterium]
MSNKYEREIEEILRNLERTEPKAGFGRKTGEHLRRKTKARGSMPPLPSSFVDWCLVLAIVAALSGGGWAYASGRGDFITGIIAMIGFAFIILVALSSFRANPRYASSTKPYNNVTPLRSNIFSRIGASWHLLLLKLRYRKRKDQGR